MVFCSYQNGGLRCISVSDTKKGVVAVGELEAEPVFND